MRCGQKRLRFTSKAAARKERIRRGSNGGNVRREYYCLHCHSWHLTSQPKRTNEDGK